MHRWITAKAAAIGLAALTFSAFAASPAAYPPSGASEVEVYVWDGGSWTPLETGDEKAAARSWNSLPAGSGGLQNRQSYTFTFTHRASVAQWIDWTISGTRKDLRLRRPGTFASDSTGFTIKSNNHVNVNFDEFADFRYAHPDSAPGGNTSHMPTWYSHGPSLTDAEKSGWTSATDLNRSDFTFTGMNPAHQGLFFKLWSKLRVDFTGNSSDYESVGIITITLSNIKHWIDPLGAKFTPPRDY